MKKLIIIIIIGLLIPVMNICAQTTYKGKVIDKNNNLIVGASITATDNKKTGTASDIKGLFSFKSNTNLATVSAVGFKSKKLSLTKNFNTIILQEAVGKLDEIIISASRETQQRKEVPASIGVLTSKDIEETKPFGIDQIVNQVPGVFMSTSKAASNEQHFMAVRSPISTKSLFLFLEDGFPIRPVAVFNHNALLEMNNTTFDRVEVLKGPASSIYGSEAIGGAFNFITKNPTEELSGSLGGQINSMGLTRFEAEAAVTANKKYGFYIGGQYSQRRNGPIEHSDYEKFAVSFKNVNKFSENLIWTNAVSFIDYRSDMTGSLSEEDYTAGNYESDQTFTERIARALRFRSTIDKQWNDNNKTSFNYIYRNNMMDQIPSYRISQFSGTGEINSNKFSSYVGLIQHKINFDFANASLIVGGTADFSPQDYVAKTISVVTDAETNKNTSYTVNEGDYILNYQADIFNYAGYAQFEISPLEKLKLTGAIRYDAFSYNYDNLVEDLIGVADTKVTYNNVSPKLGFNYNFSKKAGFYGNYSKGFTPPQTSTLFRNGDNDAAGNTVFDLKPAKFDNFEVGGYFTIPSKLKIDIALYQLDGKDRLISVQDENDNFVQLNAGETQSRGVEFGVKYNFLENLWVSYNGSYATHRYIEFFEDDVDYSDTDMATAPNYLANASINYKPLKDLLLTLEHEQVGAYNTSFEGQAVVGTDDLGEDLSGTTTYDGHSVFNFRANYTIGKFEVWGQALNIFDELYAVRASYSVWNKANSYSIGNPRAFHFGVKYNFQ